MLWSMKQTLYFVRTVDTDVVVILVGLFFDLVNHPTIVWFLDRIRYGEKLQAVSHQQYLWESGGTPITSPTSVPCFFWLWYDIYMQRKREEITVASLAGLWWRYGNIRLPGQASIYAAGCWLQQLSEAGEVDSHTVWQMESFVLRQRNTEAALLSWEPVNGKTSPYPRCSSSTCQACSIPSRYLGKQYKHSASTSISTWLWLDEGTRDIHVGTSLDYYSWGVKGMQGTH